MKNFIYILLFLSASEVIGADIIFANDFEEYVQKLNDTGITFAGQYIVGNVNCVVSVTAAQDCHQGLDNGANDNDGHAGFDFTKLDINGNPLANGSTSHSCVKDNLTGLVWEVKSLTAGVHNNNNSYQWGGLTAIGLGQQNAQGIYYQPSWNPLLQNSNNNNYCGRNNWRVPTLSELTSIANLDSEDPAIDSSFFPHTMASWYWTASPVAADATKAWSVNFFAGSDLDNDRVDAYHVRLVSDN
ncbi:MAG TPA: DUF1566 domain-containing protein [Oceanospirillales bacterium]|nr:DUF1566 domain-containing protein [Oceanospirillales bacterium]